ncbi:MAG: hypothetical protein GXP53_06695 [Deltaproteobacteria bacterium]|nr:hypothetical protein [Deltaproteobacteria bacterium]
MNEERQTKNNQAHLTLRALPLPAKALVTMVLLILSMGMAGAAGQILIHDIIPTFFLDGSEHGGHVHNETPMDKPHHVEAATGNHDHQGNNEGFFEDMAEKAGAGMVTDAPAKEETSNEAPAFYNSPQFVWLLKWTHIHLFGISLIFIILGGVTVLLDLSEKTRTWLIVLPFFGIIVDISVLWLKSYVSPAFFWLHIFGGGIFGAIFAFVFLRGIYEMWIWRNRA